MSTVAVIIARAGSKGLKNKSMKPLAGKPGARNAITDVAGVRVGLDRPEILRTQLRAIREELTK